MAFGVGVAKHLLGQGVDVIFGAGGLTGSAGIKYASAPQGTAIVIAGRTTFSGTKTEAAAPYVAHKCFATASETAHSDAPCCV